MQSNLNIPYKDRVPRLDYLIDCSLGVFKSWLGRLPEDALDWYSGRVSDAKEAAILEEWKKRAADGQVGEIS